MRRSAEWPDDGLIQAFRGSLGEKARLDVGPWLELVDLPLWGLAALFVFRISAAFRGGALGRAARWVGSGLVVVAAAKVLRGALLLLQGERLFASDLGQLIWAAMLLAAWVLAGLGIYEFYRAGRSI